MPKELISVHEDEEEVDEPLVAKQRAELVDSGVGNANGVEQSQTLGSSEYIEAVEAIASDAWDVGSWIVYLEEVEAGRAVGGVTTAEAYTKILAQFPRSAVIWKRYIEYSLKDPDVSKQVIEDLFGKCLVQCRNIELWKFYLKMVEQSTVGATTSNTTAYLVESKKYQTVLEKAIEQIGFHLDAASIWQDYLRSVRSCLELDNTVEPLRKVTIVRKNFQRAVCIPLLRMDDIWNDYENFENVNAATGGDLELTEYNKRHLHARTVLKERKGFVGSVEFDKLACPPPHSAADANQLDAWNNWIIYERGNPDNLNGQQLYEMVRLVYEQCLCCFLYNSEVWLSLAKFVDAQKGYAESLLVYQAAIAHNPSVALLRIALAEHEERAGSLDTAERVLLECFQRIPCGLSFAAYQQFLRRHKGVAAARKAFSDTMELRQSNPRLALEFYIRHAFVEETMNLSPRVALNVLNLAREKCPFALGDLSYVRAVARVLVLLGDAKQIRWLFQVALSKVGEIELAVDAEAKERRSDTNEDLRLELALVEEFLHAETILGTANRGEIGALRAKRDALKISLDEQERTRIGSAAKINRLDMKKLSLGFFGGASEFVERYDDCYGQTLPLPQLDADLRERTTRKFSLQSRDGQLGGAAKQNTEFFNTGAEFQLSLSGLPLILRDLLSRLPMHSGAAPDVDLFLKHMRGITLPPRPSAEEVEQDARQRQEAAGGGANWTDSSYEPQDSEELDEDRGDSDLFRKRQRAKLAVE